MAKDRVDRYLDRRDAELFTKHLGEEDGQLFGIRFSWDRVVAVGLAGLVGFGIPCYSVGRVAEPQSTFCEYVTSTDLGYDLFPNCQEKF